MKHFRLLLVLLTLALITSGCFGPKKSVSEKERERQEHKKHKKKDAHEKKEGEEGEDDEYDGILAAQQREFDLTHDPSTNTIPKIRLVSALAQRNKLVAQQIEQNKSITNGAVRLNGTTLPISVQNNWVERGSYADAPGPYGNARDSIASTSGRIAAFWADADPSKPNQVFIGGIDGGLWTCPDITANSPAWTFINNFSNLAISSICQDPTNYNIMYFGTGEKTWNVDAVNGGGVWKSTDHGVTWDSLPNASNFYNVSKILCDKNGYVYVGAITSYYNTGSGGLHRSTDNGATWADITPTINSMGTNAVSDMVYDPIKDQMHVYMGYFVAAFNPGAVAGYCFGKPSTVTSTTWTAATTGSGMAIGSNNTEYMVQLAVKNGFVWALLGTSNNSMILYRSIDGGVTWTLQNTFTGTIYGTGQTWYSMALDCDPLNPGQNVIFGNLNVFKSTNGGSSFTQLSRWAASSQLGSIPQYVHADVHNVYYNTNAGQNRVIVCSDGGVFYSSNGGSNWADRNKGLRLKQFYSCAINPSVPDYFLAGAQDNGCHKFTQPGLGTSTEVTGGDGAIVAIDQANPYNQIASYIYNEYHVSTDNGSTWPTRIFGDVSSGLYGQFINPFDFDSKTKKLYAAYTAGNFLRWDDPLINGTTTATLSVSSVIGSGTIATAVTVSPNLANTIYVGGSNKVAKVTNANTSTPTVTNISPAIASGAEVSSIVIGPSTTDQDMIVTVANFGVSKVFITTNGGAAWNNITGNLPDIPVRWALFYPGSKTQVYIATEAGIYYTTATNGAATTWLPSVGFPAVRSDMIKYAPTTGVIAVGTHGRGLWTSKISTVPKVSFYNSILSATKSSGTSTTATCRTYQDYSDTLQISDAPDGDATATLSIQAGGTAVQGVDFDFTTNGSFTSPSTTATFTSGTYPRKVLVLVRVYNNQNKNATLPQTATLSYTLSGATDAMISPANQTLAISLTDVFPTTPNIESIVSSGTRYETNGQSIDFFSSSNNLLLNIAGPTADLGCVTASIDSAGSTWKSFSSGTRSQKVYSVTPTTNGSTASYTATFYFTPSELGGKNVSNIRLAKTNASTIAASNSSNTVIVTPTKATYNSADSSFTASFTGFSKFFLVDNSVVLPITLVDFSAALVNGNSELKWVTASEQDNHQFDVELSTDGTNFIKLGTVLSQGNSSINQSYGYTHIKPAPGTYYYRLKQVDNDGRFTYTKIITITITGGSTKPFLYPLPAKNVITLNFGTIIQQANINLYSSDMKLIKKQTITQATVTKDIDITKLPAGIYFLRIITGTNTETLQFIKD